MTATLLGGLVVLALIDSTSFGTLLIPIWLMLAPGRLKPSRLLVFLGTVTVFYFVLGLLLTAGVSAFSDELKDAVKTTQVLIVQVILGLALLATAFRIGHKKEAGEGGRITRWRQSAMSEEGSTRALMSLALGAALLEAASMVPYLAAIGLLSTSDLAWPAMTGLLAAYCLVMIAPALVLLVLRMVAHLRIQPLLQRINDWMVRNGRENTAWIIGLVGFYLAATGAETLGWLEALNDRSRKQGD